MSLKAGRVGVRSDQVNVDGTITQSASGAYTKAESDNKFLAKTDAASTYLSKTDAAGTYETKANASSSFVQRALGLIYKIELQAVYGSDTDRPIDIDAIENGNGYIYRVATGAGFEGTAPEIGNAFIIAGYSHIVTGGVQYGVQIAIGMGADKIALRRVPYTAAGTTWSAWKYLTFT